MGVLFFDAFGRRAGFGTVASSLLRRCCFLCEYDLKISQDITNWYACGNQNI